ncbi:potassium channel family protein [Aurantiacibacter poecillastricola]|uniref:potassium channel family protein n=1 Tax=Aurantiacibacter poecillastricola TaxID=3064385 RepID=UPI00273E6ABF|nr:potassium channel family protein [Aurantiacibacter sp. 219JJ12-13]MDP5261032.1 ion transporter [Aurantiacibacter sp. 219JJ12-13]
MTASLRRKTYRQLFASSRTDGRLTLTNRLLIAVVLISVIFAVLGTEAALASEYRDIFIAAEMTFGGVFLVEYVCRVWSVAEKEGSETAWRKRLDFIISPFGLLDLAVVVASLFPLLVTGAPLFRLLRLLRLAALMKFGRFSMALRELGHAISERRYDLFVTLALAASLLLFGAAALHWAEGRVQPEAFGSIPRAMWWSIITLTTVGYGDVSPITPLGKILAAMVALSGIGLVAMPTGIIAAAFSDAMQRHRERTVSAGQSGR